MRATALMLQQDLSLSVGERVIPEPQTGEVVVDVDWAGICGSDLHVLRSGDWVAYWPATLGHEVAGRVRRSEHPRFRPGDLVVADSRIPTRAADGRLRADRLDADLQWLGEAQPGGFAQSMVIPGESLYAVPAGLDTVDAVLAEPLAVVMCAIDQVGAIDPASVLLLGYGPIGALAHAEIARRWPAAVCSVIEPNERRARLAREQGAQVLAAREERRFDLVVDAAGYPDSLIEAVHAAKFGGRVLLIAIGHAPSTVHPADIVERSLHVVGSVGFDDAHLERALAAIAADPGAFNPIVTHKVPLDEVPQFLAGERHRDAVKVLIGCAR